MITFPSGSILVKKVDGSDDFIEDALEANDIPVTATGTEFSDISVTGDDIQELFSSMATAIGNVTSSSGLSNPLSNDEWLMWEDSVAASGQKIIKLDNSDNVILNNPVTSGSLFIQYQETDHWEFTFEGDMIPSISGSQTIGGPSNYLENLYTDSLVWRTPVFPNDQWVYWRDAADSTNVPIIKMSNLDHTYIRSKDTSHFIIFDIPSVGTQCYINWGAFVCADVTAIRKHDTTSMLSFGAGDGGAESGGTIHTYGNAWTTIPNRGAIYLEAGDEASNNGGWIRLENGRDAYWELTNDANIASWFWGPIQEAIIGFNGTQDSKDITITCRNSRLLSEAPYIRLFDNDHFSGPKGAIILAAGTESGTGNVDVWTNGDSSWLFTYDDTLEPATTDQYNFGAPDKRIDISYLREILRAEKVTSSGADLTVGSETANDLHIELNNSNEWLFDESASTFRPTSDNTHYVGEENYSLNSVRTYNIEQPTSGTVLNIISASGIRFHTGEVGGGTSHRWSIGAPHGDFFTESDASSDIGKDLTTQRPRYVHVASGISVDGSYVHGSFSATHRYVVASGEEIEAGDAVSLNEDLELELCTSAYDPMCVGIMTGEELIDTKPEGVIDSTGKTHTSGTALYHIVSNGDSYCKVGGIVTLEGIKVCDQNGNITAGDFLCTSDIPGHLMGQTISGSEYTVAKCLENITFGGFTTVSGIYAFLRCG